jgi:hypothetical protein
MIKELQMIKKMIGRLLGYEQELSRLNKLFDELIDHVDMHAVFKDDQGKSIGDYNSKQIEAHWMKFNRIVWRKVRPSLKFSQNETESQFESTSQNETF